jgi:predicted nucleic acid-binding Zn ribbon protein
VLQKFSDQPLTQHEDCGGELERLISASALQFKGSGWYVTDYAKGRNRPAGSNGKPESPASKPETTSGSKSESKTESKTESKPAAKE